ncbi:MAG TPA: DUF475 domain-containing protein [Candidatus Diapherotrites archaeon]|uniref:DUF475 domain-containing protein n=1 Tax=Candidatus Iainarchaeum sp. TaxID=3101447 RepID=A0A7J4J0X5_9ARCH|nr:DUF475 domain-containing protein [Candidatus Diapherotrites archaeon]
MADILALIFTAFGLMLFEIITSIDNAVINADVLRTMSQRARKWFLLWGLLIAVFLVRGLLPFIIFWLANPTLGPIEAFTATFNSDPAIAESIEHSKPVLLVGGGIFLIFLFFHWLFLEQKSYGLRGERTIHRYGLWFYAVISIILAVVVWFSISAQPLMAFGAVVGSTAFFITHGFKENAESQEKALLEGHPMSDMSKILYLEVIDATFSIVGVIGAFAFTLSVPLILVGNGLGAFVVRELTLHNIDKVKKYRYLKNGAMYSVFFLGIIMVADSFGAHIPEYLSPLITMGVIGYFFWKSRRELQKENSKDIQSG